MSHPYLTCLLVSVCPVSRVAPAPAQVVTSVDGKRVLHISAGGNHTMAVIEHDPRSRRSHHPSGTPAATPTGHHAYGAAAGGGGGPAYSRLASYAPGHHHPSLAGSAGDARSLRDSHNGGGSVGASMGSLLGMASPFQIAQSLPVAAAAAGLQSLGQMVATVGPRSKALAAAALGSAGSGGAGSDGSRSGQGGAGGGRAGASSRRHSSSTNSRMVAIPAPSAAPFLPSGSVTRSETGTHARDLRRGATSRLHHHTHNSALSAAPHFNKSASMNNAHIAKVRVGVIVSASIVGRMV